MIVEISTSSCTVRHCVSETITPVLGKSRRPGLRLEEHGFVILVSCLFDTESIVPMFARAIMHIQ